MLGMDLSLSTNELCMYPGTLVSYVRPQRILAARALGLVVRIRACCQFRIRVPFDRPESYAGALELIGHNFTTGTANARQTIALL